MIAKIALIEGDGIGPEIVKAAVRVLDAVAKKFSHSFEYTPALLGGAAIDETGEPCPQSTIDICKACDAVLFGAIGGKKWDSLPGNLRPEKGLLTIRSALGLYANIRPALLYPELKEASPLKNSLIENGVDFVVVRELTGGIYFGERGRVSTPDGEAAYDTEYYTVKEIERIAVSAFEYAKTRKSKVTSVDKANVLESSRLWRATVESVSKRYPSVTLEHMLVDNCAMQIVKNPAQFDVLLCPNMFGDILSDEAAMITGSIGMLPSSSMGSGTFGLYEPIHGSAPDIAGKDTANPLATILSAAMLLETSLGLKKEAESIRKAVKTVLQKGIRTADIYSEGTKKVTCSEMGGLVAGLV